MSTSPSESEPTNPATRVGYVLKMYPRFSETFIVSELLAIEAAGTSVDVFSLRPPVDGRFHESLADVRAEVTYLPQASKATEVWSLLAEAQPVLGSLADHLDELLAATPVDATQAVRLAVAVRQRRITHLHAHFGSAATTVARLAALLSGVPYTFTAHAKDIFHCDVDVADLRRKLEDASAVVTVSDYNLAYLRRTYGSAASSVTRIYNGLDLDRFAFTAPGGARTPDQGPPVIAAVGRLVEKKGFADLLQAVALMVAAGRDVRLDLVGTGPLQEALAEQVDQLGLARHVQLRGALPQGRVRDVVAGASVFAAPCVVSEDGNRDGLPTVLLEAMALGTPCVATPVTGIPEVVVDGVTGLLVPERDPAALATALARLLDDRDLARNLATRARGLVEAEFDVRRQATMLRALHETTARTRQPVEVA